MKTINKLLLAGMALAGASAANAQIAVLPTAAGGSDLVLFVTDTTGTARFFEQDLGVNVDSLGVTQASVQADAVAGNEYSLFGTPGGTGSLNNPVGTNGADAALQLFMSGHAGDSYVYTIIGAATGNGSTQTGQGRFVGAYTSALAATQFSDEPSSTQTTNSASSTNSWFLALNANSPNTGYKGTSGQGLQAASSFSLTSGGNGAALGTDLYLVEVANYSDANTTDANIYQSATAINISTSGIISGFQPAAVPVPAAVWLLGSGLVGLFGISRRRVVA